MFVFKTMMQMCFGGWEGLKILSISCNFMLVKIFSLKVFHMNLSYEKLPSEVYFLFFVTITGLWRSCYRLPEK